MTSITTVDIPVVCSSLPYRNEIEDAYVDLVDRLHETTDSRLVSRRRPLTQTLASRLPDTWGRSSVGLRSYYALRAFEPTGLLPFTFPLNVRTESQHSSTIRGELSRLLMLLQSKATAVFGEELPLLIVATRSPNKLVHTARCCIGLDHDFQLETLRYVVRAHLSSEIGTSLRVPIRLVRDRIDWVSTKFDGYPSVLDNPGSSWLAMGTRLNALAKQLYLADHASHETTRNQPAHISAGPSVLQLGLERAWAAPGAI